MNFEALIKAMARSFCIIVTGIVAGNYVVCLLFDADAMLPVRQFGEILLCAALSDLPFVIFYSRRELGKKRMLLRQVIHGVVLLAVLMTLARVWNWISFDSPFEIAVFLLIIVMVYLAVYAASYWSDKKTADRLTQGLRERYPK